MPDAAAQVEGPGIVELRRLIAQREPEIDGLLACVTRLWQMREGTEQEPNARRAYDLETGNIVQEVGAISTDDDLYLYSPDGLIGEDGLLVRLKTEDLVAVLKPTLVDVGLED